MKALILAAGRGARLRPMTDSMPKPMVSLRGVPLLEYTLSILPKQIDEIIIIVGYLPQHIRNYFGGSFGGRPIEYIRQPEPRGTFHALKQAENILLRDSGQREEFMVVSGDDVYCARDLERVVSSPGLSLLANRTAQPERFGICRIDESGYLTDIIEKPPRSASGCGDLANIGVYKLNQQIFDEAVHVGPNGEEVLAPMIGALSAKQKIEVIPATFWHPIADMEDWRRAQTIVI